MKRPSAAGNYPISSPTLSVESLHPRRQLISYHISMDGTQSCPCCDMVVTKEYVKVGFEVGTCLAGPLKLLMGKRNRKRSLMIRSDKNIPKSILHSLVAPPANYILLRKGISYL